MKHYNKNRMLAGVFAVLFVLQASAQGMSVFAEDGNTDSAAVTLTDAAAQAPTEADTDAENPPMPTESYTTPTEEAKEDKLTLTGAFTMPDQITKGSDVAIAGKINSEVSAMTALTVGVYGSDGAFLTGKTINPGSDFYDISQLDAEVDFKSLAVGTYSFAVVATNAAKSNVSLMLKQFEVKEAAADTAADAITITGDKTKIPETLTAGQPVSVKGVVTSASSNLTSVIVGVYDENNTRMTSASASPDALSYDLSRLDSLIAFDSLTAGSYVYRVTASNAANTGFTVEEIKFTVAASGTQSPAANDTLTVTGITDVPESFTQGSVLNVKGTVTSASSNIIYLTCGVYSATGEFVTGKTVAPRAASFDLSRLDPYVAFDKLAAGDYIFAVIASNAANNNYALINQKFTVKAKDAASTDTPVTEDKITATGITQIPDTIKKGQAVSVRGTVTSAVSNITQLTVSVTDAEGGGWMTGKTIDNVGAKTYNIAKLDQYVLFNKLPDGVYNFNVLVTNAANKQFAVYTKKFTVGTGNASAPVDTAEDTMVAGNLFAMPDSIKKGQAVSVTGTVTSKVSDLKALTVGVYDKDGNFKTGKTINPAAKTYDLRNLDRYVAFNLLADGEYTFALIASNASKTNEALYTKKFTVGSDAGTAADNAADTLTLTGLFTIPGTIKPNTALKVTGTVTSAVSNLTAVTAGVYDADNNLVTGKTVNLSAKTFDLSTLDSAIKFNQLTAEKDYTFRVYASNAAKTNHPLISQKFVVTNGSTPAADTTDTLTLTGGTTIPDTLKVGQTLSITGTVTSASSNMTALTCGVYNSNGTFVTGKTINPKSKTYNLKNLDAAVEFNKLAAGTYTYAVIASNAANNNFTILSKKFTVGDAAAPSTGANDLTITGGTEVPANLAVGKALNVKGTVTSGSNMTALTVGVYDTAGNFKTGKTINPNAKTYNLANLDKYVEFNKLAAGSYVYAVIVSNGSQNNYALVNKTFTVGSTAGGNADAGTDALTITGGTNVPDTLASGRALSIFGTVTSSSSNMTALTCGVYNSSGQFVTGRTINPNAKSYDLKKLDAYVAFNSLPNGTYTYAVIASNAAHTNYTLVSKKFTVGSGSSTSANVTLTGGTTVPSTLAKGKGVIVRGTVTSGDAIQKVEVIVRKKGTTAAVTGASATPNTTTYNLNALDSKVRFDQLAAGTYEYVVNVTTKSGTQSLTVQAFVVQ